jgi:hypothetical protein
VMMLANQPAMPPKMIQPSKFHMIRLLVYFDDDRPR